MKKSIKNTTRLQLPVLFLFFSCITMHAQNEKSSRLNFISGYAVEIPGGDLKERFGLTHNFGFGIEYEIEDKRSFFARANFRFGDDVKEDVLAIIRNSDGFVSGVNGFYGDIFGRKRGAGFSMGYHHMIPIKISENNHNIRIGLSGTYLTHWIRVFDDLMSVPQIQGDYSQIFDRFTSGFGIQEELLFQYKLKNNRASFLFGFEFTQGFTKDLRSNLFFESNAKRLDLYHGIKVVYLLPLYRFQNPDTIYY